MVDKEEQLLKEFKNKSFKFPKIKNPEIKVPKEIKINMRNNVIKILEERKKSTRGDRKFKI